MSQSKWGFRKVSASPSGPWYGGSWCHGMATPECGSFTTRESLIGRNGWPRHWATAANRLGLTVAMRNAA